MNYDQGQLTGGLMAEMTGVAAAVEIIKSTAWPLVTAFGAYLFAPELCKIAESLCSVLDRMRSGKLGGAEILLSEQIAKVVEEAVAEKVEEKRDELEKSRDTSPDEQKRKINDLSALMESKAKISSLISLQRHLQNLGKEIPEGILVDATYPPEGESAIRRIVEYIGAVNVLAINDLVRLKYILKSGVKKGLQEKKLDLEKDWLIWLPELGVTNEEGRFSSKACVVARRIAREIIESNMPKA